MTNPPAEVEPDTKWVSRAALERARHDGDEWYDPLDEAGYVEKCREEGLEWLRENWQELPPGERDVLKHYLTELCHDAEDVAAYRRYLENL
jgi:hypothetical protein